MDVYHAWFNLTEDVPNLQIVEAACVYLERLKEEGRRVAYRTRAASLVSPRLTYASGTSRLIFLA